VLPLRMRNAALDVEDRSTELIVERTPNLAGLVTGIALMTIGFAVVLDDAGQIDLEFAYGGPLILASLGAILLASGLAARRRGS
jgi:hypothetical protein